MNRIIKKILKFSPYIFISVQLCKSLHNNRLNPTWNKSILFLSFLNHIKTRFSYDRLSQHPFIRRVQHQTHRQQSSSPHLEPQTDRPSPFPSKLSHHRPILPRPRTSTRSIWQMSPRAGNVHHVSSHGHRASGPEKKAAEETHPKFEDLG